jgi:hypothetical protein
MEGCYDSLAFEGNYFSGGTASISVQFGTLLGDNIVGQQAPHGKLYVCDKLLKSKMG